MAVKKKQQKFVVQLPSLAVGKGVNSLAKGGQVAAQFAERRSRLSIPLSPICKTRRSAVIHRCGPRPDVHRRAQRAMAVIICAPGASEYL